MHASSVNLRARLIAPSHGSCKVPVQEKRWDPRRKHAVRLASARGDVWKLSSMRIPTVASEG
jgi:hypothetical protein